MVGKLTV